MYVLKKSLNIFNHLLLLLAIYGLFSCGDVIDDKQAVILARQYLEQNKLREAGLELKGALQSNPDNAEARYLLGGLNIILGDMASAAKDFRKAEEAGWDEADTQIGLARALIFSRDFETVINNIQIKEGYTDSARANLYGLKAFSYAALGDLPQARKLINEGRAFDANAFQILKTDIQLKVTDNNSDNSREEINQLFDNALSHYQGNPELLLLIAYVAMQSKDVDKAAQQFHIILDREPDHLVTFNGRSARLGLARIQVIKKEFDQAKKTLAPLFKQSPADPETNYIGGLLSFEEGELDVAEERLLKVLKVVPEHSRSHLLFGAVNFGQKNYEQAAYYLEKYLKAEPDDISARKLLGRVYILTGQSEQAQATLKIRSEAEGENDAELLALVGLSSLQGGDTKSGISSLERAVTVAPKSNSLRSELAKAYISAGETKNAIKQLESILAEGGDKDQAEVLMVAAYLSDRQFDPAINLALELLQRNPDDPAMLSLVGNVFAVSGDHAEARKYLTRAREIDSDYVVATMLLAALEESENNVAAAEALYKSIDSEKTSSIDHFLALARLSSGQQQPEKMLMWLEKARQTMPTDIRSRLILVEYYLQAKEIAKVEALAKEAMAIAPDDPRMLMLQGKLFMAQQRYNEALAPLKKLVTMEPKSIVGRVLLSKIYIQLGQMKDARKQLELASQINEFDIATLLLLTRVELSEGRLDKALTYCRKIQQVNPDLYLSYELEGDIYVKSKKFSKAKAVYERVIRLEPSSALTIKLSDVLVNMNHTADAKRRVLEWLDNNPDDIKVRQYLGSLQQASGENAEAIDTFNMVLKLQPENVAALNNIAWLYSLSNNPAAIKMAEKAYELVPDNPGIQDTYGWVLVLNGQHEKGEQILAKAIKSLPDVAEVQYHYATALVKTGESIEAKKRLTQLLKDHQSFTGIEDARQLQQSLR